MFNLIGRVAVVTGASSGIGQALAIALARSGCDVATIYITVDDIEKTREGVEGLGRRFFAVQGDVSDSRQVRAFADKVHEVLGGPHIWINNAGKLMIRPILETSDSDWKNLLAINLNGYFFGAREAVRIMSPHRFGRIINITSITESQPIPNASAYITSKGGILGMTRALAVELAPIGITVNAIAPGAIHTRLNSDVYTDEVQKIFNARIPIGRIGIPADLASAVIFFAANESGYVTGQQIAVDGGMTLNGDVGLGVK